MKLTIRGIVCALLALSILLTSALAPASAYAGGLNSRGSSSYAEPVPFRTVKAEQYPSSIGDRLVDAAIDGATETLGYAAGMLAVCYAADGLATTVFPPAAALAPVCQVIPGLFVAAKGTQVGVRGTQVVLKAAVAK